MTGTDMTATDMTATDMTAPAPVDFWFDFASPYAYLLSEKLDTLAARHGRVVRWRPVLLFAVLRALELPAPLASPAKRAYMLRDFERSARHLGVPFRLPEAFSVSAMSPVSPATTQHAARAFYLIDRLAPAAAVCFARQVFRAYFRHGALIDRLALVADWAAAAAPSLGEPARVAAMLQAAEAKLLLADAIDAAVRQRVFGSPFVVVDGEPFFGADRLPQIEAVLAGTLAPAPEPLQRAEAPCPQSP
jgi:2-hydroxychromene-2-carboxylate isomerase